MLLHEQGFGCADSDDALLKMTITQQEFGRAGLPDLSSMTEEEQIAYAMQMSLQGAGECLEPIPKGKAQRQVLCLQGWSHWPLRPTCPEVMLGPQVWEARSSPL